MRRADGARLALLLLVVAITRLPFLDAGYGQDPDAWRLAATARRIATSGEYSASRLPGYPVQELASAALWRQGPRGLNGATALLSLVAVAFFVRSLRTLGARDPLVAGLALALTPVVFVNSTNAMDYGWALAAVLMGHAFALERRPWLAGLAAGLAIGCRLSAAVMLVPMAVLLARRGSPGGGEVGRVVRFAAVAAFTAVAALAPVIVTYGREAFAFYDYYPPLAKVVYRASIGVWGTIGCLGLGAAALMRILQRQRTPTAIPAAAAPRGIVLAWWLAVGLGLLPYLRLPHEAGYLVPVVPFVLLLAARWLERRAFILLCVLLMLSAVLLTIDRHGVRLPGPILTDHRRRVEELEYIERVLTRVDRFAPEERAVIVAGTHLVKMAALPGHDRLRRERPGIELISLIDARQLADYQQQGLPVYYLPPVRDYNLTVHDLDLAASAARPLPLE